MKRPLRLGVVGCGDIARYMAFFARLNPRIALAACCDLDIARAERFARQHKIPLFSSDYGRMLTVSRLDAVYLAVPHDLHFEMARIAIDARLPVLIEKPITRTLEEGRAIAAHAAACGVKVGVNYQYRYDQGCYALARVVQSGLLGSVFYARVNVPWHREPGYFTQSAWHASRSRSGGGTLLTQGSHLLDVVLWAIASPPLLASGKTAQAKFKQVEVEDLAMGILTLSNGALVQVCSAMVATPEQSVSIEIYGERGTALYASQPFPHARFLGVKVRQERPPVWGLHALQCSLEGFRRWIVADQPFLTPAESALPVLAAIEALYRSSETGKQEVVAAIVQ